MWKRLTINSTGMILSGLNTDSFCLHDIQCFEDRIKNHNLRIALPNLPLSVVHIRPTKAVDLIIVNTRSMAAPAENSLHRIGRAVSHIPPLGEGLVINGRGRHIQFGNIFDRVEILTTNQIRSLVAEWDGRVLPGRWHPVLLRCLYQLGVERLSFLHPLNVVLQTSPQLFSQLIARDIIWRLRFEKLHTFVVRFGRGL